MTGLPPPERFAVRSRPGTGRPGYGLALAAVILAGAALLYFACANSVAHWQFGDPDDIMRLQEVRDWIGGQSWFDVTQYRIDAPTGLKMHWSRLLDVPLAAVILSLRPMLGEIEAERAACVIVPLLTFAIVALLTAAVAWRTLCSRPFMLLAAAFCAANIGIMSTTRPMRIDHHGWQVVCGLGMVWGLLGPRKAPRAVIAGLCAAFWMHISLEGLVFTAGCGAWLGLRWLLKPADEGATLPAYMAAVAAGSLAFFLIGHGGALFDQTFCDAISPVHIVAFAAATMGSALVVRLSPAALPMRTIALGSIALVCAAIYKLWAPQCGGGPFAALTPLTYHLWYQAIGEGLPLWRQPLAIGLGWIAYPLVGIAGAAYNARTAPPEQRGIAIDYAALLVLATAIGAVLCRASAFSNILAVPGGLMLLRSAYPRISAVRLMPLRALLHALTLLALLPASAAALAIGVFAPPEKVSGDSGGAICLAPANLAHMNALPVGTVMTTLGSSEALIFASHHRAVSAGYHRNVTSMDDTLRFFTGDDGTARAILLRRHADFVFVCSGGGEIARLARAAPGNLAERLPKGDAPTWLTPVKVPGLQHARVYAVNR